MYELYNAYETCPLPRGIGFSMECYHLTKHVKYGIWCPLIWLGWMFIISWCQLKKVHVPHCSKYKRWYLIYYIYWGYMIWFTHHRRTVLCIVQFHKPTLQSVLYWSSYPFGITSCSCSHLIPLIFWVLTIEHMVPVSFD